MTSNINRFIFDVIWDFTIDFLTKAPSIASSIKHNTRWCVHWVVTTSPVESNIRLMRTPDSHLQGHEAVWKQPSTTWYRDSKHEDGDGGMWALNINNEKCCLSKRTKLYSSRTYRCSPQYVACIRGYEPSGSSYSNCYPIAFITRLHFRHQNDNDAMLAAKA